MKFPKNLSGGLLLALSIAVPSVFISTAAKAQPIVNKPPLELNRVQTSIKFAPNVIDKVDVLRPVGGANSLNQEAFSLEGFVRTSAEPLTPASKIKLDTIRPSAVNTFRSLNK